MLNKFNTNKPLSLLIKFSWTIFLLILISACSSGKKDLPATLEIAPTTAEVTVGDTAINFTATLNNSSETINWSLTGAGSIPADATGKTVSYTPPHQEQLQLLP